MLNVRRENNEVAYATDVIARVAKSDIEELVEQALRNPRHRVRVCTHRAPESPLHEMLIVHTKDTYVRPHKHLHKSESFHVIQGEMDVVVFDDEGTVTDVLRLGDYRSGRTFYYRMHEPLFHTLLIRSDVVIFHEITVGPFRRRDTVFPTWEPDCEDPRALLSFRQQLEQAVFRFFSQSA
jgi:cupin fold WbuC family metalloprotein